MHISLRRPPNRRGRTPFLLGALVLVGSLLTACGVVDEADTKFRIVFESLTHEDSLAPIGAFMPGEQVKMTFEVTPKDRGALDRTQQAEFWLADDAPGEDASHFHLVPTANWATLPYHTVLSHEPGAEAQMCVSYDGPEVLTSEPLEFCEKILVLDPADYEE